MRSKNTPYCTIGFRDVKLRVIGIPLVSFIMLIAFFNCSPFDGCPDFWIKYSVTFLHVFIFWHMDRAIVLFFRKKFPYFNQYKERLTLQIFTVFVVTILLEYASIPLEENWQNFTNTAVQSPVKQNFIGIFFVTITILAIYESMYAFDMWRLGIIEYERLKKENVTAQLDALKSQVNPHFLFNSLNTLAALIPEDPELAVEFVEKLSKVYRFVLEIKDKKVISLKEELKAIDAYGFLLKMRFGENIRFTKNINPTEEQASIPPLSIQILVENTVKHNIISSKKPLCIDIYTEGDYVVVKNNLQTKKQVQPSTKMGLMNIQKRYALLSDKIPVFNVEETFFIAKLPLLSN